MSLKRLKRDVVGIQIPDGNNITVPKDTAFTLHQSLGGSYTITTEKGLLVRIEGEDGDAISEKVIQGPKIDPNASVEDQVWAYLRTVFDPEIPVNIVELGLIYECKIEPDSLYIKMTLTAPGCGMGQVLADEVKRKLEKIGSIKKVTVELTFDPPWDRSMMSEAAKLELGLI